MVELLVSTPLSHHCKEFASKYGYITSSWNEFQQTAISKV